MATYIDRDAQDVLARIRTAVRLLYGEQMLGNPDAWRDAAQRLEPLLEELVEIED